MPTDHSVSRALPREHVMRWITWLRSIRTLLLVTLVVGASATSPTAQEPENTDRETGAEDNPFMTRFDQRAGERIFQRQCSRCHGQDATGNDETGAPDITTGRFSNASSPAGVFDVIRNGVRGTAMLPVAPTTSDENIWQLVTYIDSLSTNPSDFNLAGNASSGRQVYAGKGDCASCHMISAEGNRLGPDLSRVGERLKPDELKAALVTPGTEVDPRWWTVTVTRADGSTVEGLRMGEDTFTLRLMDEDERLWSFSKSDIRSYERYEDTNMQSYEQTLTAGEIDDLVAYLFTLRKERTQ